MIHAGMSYQAISETPLRVLNNLLDYMHQTAGYKPKPKKSVMDTQMKPSEFKAMVDAMRKSR